ncbi:glycosyl hydrolases family 31-domain-containing protein, partial [Obelidium mucronatum]
FILASSAFAAPPHRRSVFSVLTPRLIRLEFSATSEFNNNDSLGVVNRYISPPPVFRIEYTADGFIHNLSIQYLHSNGSNCVWKPSMDPGYGNLGGTVRTLDDYYQAPDLDCRFETNPNQHCTYGLLSREGWTLVDDSGTPRLEPLLNATFDFPWVQKPSEDFKNSTNIDWYFLGYGLDFKAALQEWTLVSGKIPLIPKYALGSWSSRYWAYNEAEFMKIAHTYHQNRIPLDVLVLDMDWHKTFYSKDGGLWTGWTWDPNLFPNPSRFLSALRELGIRSTVNLHPADGVMAHEDMYPEMARRLGYSGNTTIPFQSTNSTFMKEFLGLVISGLQNDGVDFFWLDWQQGEDWKQWTGVKGLNPTMWLNYVFWKFSDISRNETRPLNFHRWGGLGNHRYPIGFSALFQGILFPSWEMLQTQIKFTVTASNVLFGYWSHDLGGHMTVSEKQLYTRWVQFGAWSPIFRTHSTKSGVNVRYFWKYPRPESDIMAAALKGRMELLPYIYTMTRVARDTGLSLLRPLYYEYPEMEEAYSFGSEYFFGDALGPLAKMLVETSFWIPPGTWLEKTTGKVLLGPAVHSGLYFLEDVPVLQKSGSILAKSILSGNEYFGLASIFPRVLGTEIFLGDASSGSFELYEDDGITSDYDNAERQLLTRIEFQRSSKDGVSIFITPRVGNMTGLSGSRSHRLIFPNIAVIQSVSVNGAALDCSQMCGFDVDTMAAFVQIGEFDIGQTIAISLQFPSDDETKRVPNGLLGKFKRLSKAKEMLDDLWEVVEPPVYQDYYPSLLQALGLIQSTQYDAAMAGSYLKKADLFYQAAIAEVEEMVMLGNGGDSLKLILAVLQSSEPLNADEVLNYQD